ncbi:MAG: hypothetical protein IJU50_00785 [Lachnospiraceae bacterium]|nr:hypothetical protein [Lachnospiraceae bacterium]
MSAYGTSEVGSSSASYSAYQTSSVQSGAGAKPATQTEETRNVENTKAAEEQQGAVYEKGSTGKPATYSGKTMSKEERTNLINKLKAEQESHQSQLQKIAEQLISGQTKSYGMANAGDDSNNIWNFLRKGNFTVDAATKKQAQEDISEDGYYGIKQTSQRLFDFAKSLAGDDVEKMKKMQSAIEKGYKQAEKTWGGELPQISKDTLDATNKLFDEYYKSVNGTAEA